MDIQKAFEKHIKHDALKKKPPVRLKKRRKTDWSYSTEGNFCLGFLNKLNANNLIAIVNTDPKNRAGFRGI